MRGQLSRGTNSRSQNQNFERYMNTKPKVRVIKKSAAQSVERKSPPKEKSAKETAREMVATVADWVGEFQRKSRNETASALKKVFPKNPQTSGI
jgi:hypothetical protein